MFLSSNRLKDFVKEKVCKIYDTIDYAALHPFSTLRKISHESTINFILDNCPRATICRTPQRLIDIALSNVEVEGAFLEFGVFKGGSINYIARKSPQQRIDGFDSFEGLQEAWVNNEKYAFSVGGVLPKVKRNVDLHKGFFDKTLPLWLADNQGRVAFMHIDCDLYSSTKIIFDCLRSRLQPGSIIVFDDYFNFPNWEEYGHKVLQEFQKETNLKYEYLGFAYKEIAIKINSID
jgi:hypothetical protein